ncbi:MAG: cupin domain-containing protein [Anaerolineae bacterium]|nr:cupin domain-containing protein [Anaerolineae bacterium]
MSSHVLVVQANEGRDIGGVICKVRSEATNGQYSILELSLAPGQGAPPHIHHREDEIFNILEGECVITAQEKSQVAKAGAVVVLPRGVAHAFRNASDAPTRIMITAVPGGLETFFEEANRVAADDPEANSKLAAIAQRHQLEFLKDA